MKKFIVCGLFVLAWGCAKKLEHTVAVASTTVRFDPGATVPLVPAPNDLAIDPATGLLSIPVDPNGSSAQQAFTAQYLNTLKGFPFESTATVSFSGPVDPVSINPSTVLITDLGPVAGPAQSPTSVAVIPNLDSTGSVVSVAPPGGQWARGHRYVALVLGGPTGVKDLKGMSVTGNPIWYLVSSASPLVTCQTLSDPNCRPTSSVIPSSATDPALRLADQTTQSIALERLRRGYAPLFNLAQAQGHARSDIAALWTFTIVDRPELTFDPAHGVIPFPNDILRIAASPGQVAHINIPIPPNATPSQTGLIQGLNTLDGFSTTAPIVSSNSDTQGALGQGTLVTAQAHLVKLGAQGQPIASPDVTACISCAETYLHSIVAPGVVPFPQRLELVPNLPLEEKSTYFAYVLDDLVETQGATAIASPAFALLKLKSPLIDNVGRTQVSIISDAQAQALEPLRLALQPALASLEAQGIDRAHLLLAWAFTTGSITNPAQPPVLTLASLKGLPAQLGLPLDVTAPALLNQDAVTGNYRVQGTFKVAFSLKGPGGVLDPRSATVQDTAFLAIVPKSAGVPGAGKSPLPVVIFGHGLGGNKNQVLASLADSLASAGFIVVATDVVFHGERSDCRGSHVLFPGAPSDSYACADPATESCSAATGFCVNNNQTPGGDFLRCCPSTGSTCVSAAQNPACAVSPGAPVISGWNLLNLNNLFAARDNFRQQVIDLSQLTRVIVGSPSVSGSTSFEQALSSSVGMPVDVDETQIDYVGVSLGGILGSLYTSVSPEIHRVVLNVPGGGLINVLLSSPGFVPQKTAFVGALGAQGIPAGSAAFDDFIATAKWITDPADPLNAAYGLTHDLGGNTPYLPFDRKVLIQYIAGDQTIPNSSSESLIAAARFSPDKAKGEAFKFSGTDISSSALRHGFLLEPGASGDAARSQINNFLLTGTLP